MTPPRRTHHLLGVWNPSYEQDAMAQHLEVLLRHARAYRAKGADGDDGDVYVWWGKVRSPNRQQPLAHLAAILALDAALDTAQGGDRELHLYLTDYRSLYVAHVAEVTEDDVLEEDDDDHVPAYYRREQLRCDCWFRLFDIRRVVADDTLDVIAELKRLRNVRYHDRPVSLYGGMVDLPLIVWREDDVRWFDRALRERYTDGRFWAEFDAEQGGTGAMQGELRDHRFGPVLWGALDPAVRSFIASAEQIFRTHHRDAAFDLSPVALNLARALEFQVNTLLRASLSTAPADLRWHNVDGVSRDLTSGANWTLGELAEALEGDDRRTTWLADRVRKGRWFTGVLPAVLRRVAGVRNPAAHGAVVPREEVVRLRSELVGVGCNGALVEVAGVVPPAPAVRS
ncbi:MAG TPA: hypothetical protein VFV33_13145 [Gemmatimonadaceae bacterium]|nr:hypothetical protein [Gemmatimonadaceae bacterium]